MSTFFKKYTRPVVRADADRRRIAVPLSRLPEALSASPRRPMKRPPCITFGAGWIELLRGAR